MREIKDHFLLSGQMKPGDVLMVAREMKDKHTKKPFTWRFLAVAAKVGRHTAELIRLGADEGKGELIVHVRDDRLRMQVLTEDEWPDGARAFRTVLMLDGRLDPTLT